MGLRVKKDGYSAELTDDLAIVYRNPQGRKLKQFPHRIAGAPGLEALSGACEHLRRQRTACRDQGREWASAGASVPRALAEADPLWRKALADEGVALTDELGEGGLFARTYVGFDGHTLTQLLPEALIPYRDLLMRAEHWEPDGLFSTGIPDPSGDELPFPERVIAAHPGSEELSVRKILALEEETFGWDDVYSKKDIDAVLKEVEQADPALLSTLLDEMADLALQEKDEDTAAAWFGRARKAGRLGARMVDKEWLYGRYLTYAGEDALSATALRDWARELAVKGVATEADLVRFRTVALRRVAASGKSSAYRLQVPVGVYPQLAADVRKIARAAGLDPEEELATLLKGIFAAERWVSLDDEKFWINCLKGRAMDLLGDHGAQAARQVLELRPRQFTDGLEVWPQLLARTGALAQLTGETPGLPDGAAAAWLTGCVGSNSLRSDGLWPALYELAEKIAPRLAADGVPVEFRYCRSGRRNAGTTPLDLIDLLLEHGVPVADPPEFLGPSPLEDLRLERRPKLEHLRADERFARELRARLRANLDMRSKDFAGTNCWYQPHGTNGWQQIPQLFDNPIGHEELRAWCDRERARLRAGVNLNELVRLLSRFVHVGVAVDLLLKDAEAAREFAAVDVIALLMAEMPEGVSRAEASERLEKVRPGHHSAGEGVTVRRIRATLQRLREPTTDSCSHALAMATNCRVGLERLVRRFTPAQVPESRPGG
ncbi:hypothetical protein AB0D04_08510 [Streptomyces sp. NPDC048483]|uniref:hypothetical protein n=1 Tax=Streptomyces sp. NPDC048483 TaxID=3154927 RepID=UPI00342FB011